MTEPISLDVLLREFNEDSEAWVLQDEKSKKYITIPHIKYPGKQTIHFFLSRKDAQALFLEIIEVNDNLKDLDIFPVKVKLLGAIRGIASDKNIGSADSFVVHSPNEVYEYLSDR